MAMLSLLHTLQALTAAYTSFFSYISIRKTQTYEDMTTKAAKYSNTADHHLQTTRSTMGAGAVATFTSLSLSAYLLLRTTSPLTAAVLSAIVGVGITVAHTHISNYWRGKAKVPLPGSGDYNDAISTSNRMRSLLGGLALSWGVVAVWYLGRWISS